MKTTLCLLVMVPGLLGCAHVRTAKDLAHDYEAAHCRKHLGGLLALYDTEGASARAIRRCERDEERVLDLRIAKTEVRRFAGDNRLCPDSKLMLIHYDIDTQTNRSTVIVRASRVLKRRGAGWRLLVTVCRVEGCVMSFSDSDIRHYRKRAQEVLNDADIWRRLGVEFDGPFDVSSDDFRYRFDYAGEDAPLVVVQIAVQIPERGHPSFVRIAFDWLLDDVPEEEIVSIELHHSL